MRLDKFAKEASVGEMRLKEQMLCEFKEVWCMLKKRVQERGLGSNQCGKRNIRSPEYVLNQQPHTTTGLCSAESTLLERSHSLEWEDDEKWTHIDRTLLFPSPTLHASWFPMKIWGFAVWLYLTIPSGLVQRLLLTDLSFLFPACLFHESLVQFSVH